MVEVQSHGDPHCSIRLASDNQRGARGKAACSVVTTAAIRLLKTRPVSIACCTTPTRPRINKKALLNALESLIYDSGSKQPSSLEQLLIVREKALGPAMPDSAQMRRMALQQVLIALIYDHYVALRRARGLPAVQWTDSLTEALVAIREDGLTAYPPLLGWGLLYYRFARDELEISREQFCEVATVVYRSLTRYQNHALAELEQALAAREMEAVQRRHRIRLYDALPMRVPVRLIGRRDTEQQLATVLADSQPKHVQIIGSAGAGKTSFVQETVRDQINQGGVDHVLWLDRPQSIVDVEAALLTLVCTAAAAFSLTEYLSHYQVIVVLDQIEALSESVGPLQQVLAEIAKSTVYIIGQRYLPLVSARGRVALLPLSREDAAALIEQELRLHYPETRFSKEEVEEIWEHVGGNPARIKAFVQDMHQVFA